VNASIRSLLETAKTISAVDGVDIALVAAVLYFAMRMAQGTRGAQVIRGLLILGALLVVTRPFGTLNWLVSNAVFPGILALVVIFQPEIRLALSHIGAARPLFRDSFSSVAGTVSEALTQLSVNRTGALLAFERNVSLDDIAATGTRLDAKLSVELLNSIFFPHNALHDGGVVIRNDQIVAAACYFPPSTNPHIDRAMGMRHRAALGLSEQTDAVVAVVSEETGAISLAVAGVIERRLDRATFRRKLLGYLAQEASPTMQWLRRRTVDSSGESET